MNVRDHLARIFLRAQETPDQIVEADLLGTCDLDRVVQRRRERDVKQSGHDVVGDDRLQESRRQADRLPLGGGFGNAVDELEELCRAQDRIGNHGVFDQLFLGHLGAQVAALRNPVGTDHRQRDMMPHARGRLGGHQVAARLLEELQDSLVFERWRVRHIDDEVGARQRFGQPFAGDGVDARAGRGRVDLVAQRAQLAHQLGADEAAAANDRDPPGRLLPEHETSRSILQRPPRSMCRGGCLRADRKTLRRASMVLGFALDICPKRPAAPVVSWRRWAPQLPRPIRIVALLIVYGQFWPARWEEASLCNSRSKTMCSIRTGESSSKGPMRLRSDRKSSTCCSIWCETENAWSARTTFWARCGTAGSSLNRPRPAISMPCARRSETPARNSA